MDVKTQSVTMHNNKIGNYLITINKNRTNQE